MPVTSSQSFLQVLEKSSLLPSDKLDEVRRLCEQENDPKSVARTLIKDGVLTKWQALQLLAGRYALTIGDYALLDQVESDEATRVFLTRHPSTGELAQLRTMTRRQAKESSDAVEQFVAKVQQEAGEQKRKVLAIQRPTEDDERCFVVVAKSSSGMAAGDGKTNSETPQKKVSPEGKTRKDSSGGFQIGPIGDSSAAAAAPAPGGFVIETGPKRRRKVRKAAPGTPSVAAPAKKTLGKSPAKAPAAVATQPTGEISPAKAGEAKDAAEVGDENLKAPMGLLIGGAVVAGLLLTTGLVMLGFYLAGRGGDDPTELAAAGAAETQDTVGELPDENAPDPQLPTPDPGADIVSDPVVAVVPTADPVVVSDPVVPVIDPAPAVAADTLAETPTSAEPPAIDDANVVDADDPSSPATPPATAADEEPEPGSETDVAAVEMQDDPSSVAETAEPPPAEQTPPVPNKKPFTDLAAVFALPDLEDGQAKTLGSVYVPEGELCFVKLRGGADACKGSQTLGSRNGDGGLAERDWEISARDGDAGAEVKIAHMALNDRHELTFQWQPEAATQPVAAYLTNCAFSFSCAGESHVATMRKPEQVEGMLVDFDKSITKDSWVIDSCPEPASVRIEVVGVQGAKFKVDPAPVFEADNGSAWVRIEDGGGMLALKLETSMRRNLQLSIEPHVQATPNVPAQKFSARLLERSLAEAMNFQQDRTLKVKMLQQALKQPNIPDQQKKRELQPRLAMFEAELTQAEAGVKKLQALEQLMTALSGNMRLKFRVFYDADSSQVDLLRIGS